MESGKITDDQISASSSFYDERWLPRQARLNFNDNGWTPNEDSNREYIQVSDGSWGDDFNFGFTAGDISLLITNDLWCCTGLALMEIFY